MSKRGVLKIEWIPLNPLLMLFTGWAEFEREPEDAVKMLEQYAKELKLSQDVVNYLCSAIVEGRKGTTKWTLVVPHLGVPTLIRISWIPGGVVVPYLRNPGFFDLLSVLFGE